MSMWCFMSKFLVIRWRARMVTVLCCAVGLLLVVVCLLVPMGKQGVRAHNGERNFPWSRRLLRSLVRAAVVLSLLAPDVS